MLAVCVAVRCIEKFILVAVVGNSVAKFNKVQ